MWHLPVDQPARVLSPLFFQAKSFLLPKPRGKRKHPKATWSYSLSGHVVPTSAKASWSPKRHMVPKRDTKWLPHLGLNPSANLPLQVHFWLHPQLATAASIRGRCGPVVWSQWSPSSSGPHYKSLFGAPLLAAPCYTLSLKINKWNLFFKSMEKDIPLMC